MFSQIMFSIIILYVIFSIFMSISIFNEVGFFVTLSGTLSPIIGLAAGAGLKGSFYDTTTGQKLGGIFMGMIFLLIGLLWVYYEEYYFLIFNTKITGIVWVIVGFIIGLICTTKEIALNEKKEK